MINSETASRHIFPRGTPMRLAYSVPGRSTNDIHKSIWAGLYDMLPAGEIISYDCYEELTRNIDRWKSVLIHTAYNEGGWRAKLKHDHWKEFYKEMRGIYEKHRGMTKKHSLAQVLNEDPSQEPKKSMIEDMRETMQKQKNKASQLIWSIRQKEIEEDIKEKERKKSKEELPLATRYFSLAGEKAKATYDKPAQPEFPDSSEYWKGLYYDAKVNNARDTVFANNDLRMRTIALVIAVILNVWLTILLYLK